MPLQGSCLCGNITYTVDAESFGVSGLCHCTNCHKLSGSCFSANGVTKAELLSVKSDKEPVKTYQMKGGSGIPLNINFCPICSCHLFTSVDQPGAERVVVKVGTLDQPLAKMGMEMFTRSKDPFLGDKHVVEGALQFTAGPQAPK